MDARDSVYRHIRAVLIHGQVGHTQLRVRGDACDAAAPFRGGCAVRRASATMCVDGGYNAITMCVWMGVDTCQVCVCGWG
eukprot:gene11810-biopygen7847